MAKTKPPTDAFMGMLDLAWEDFRTYREHGDDSKPIGIAIVLIGKDTEGMLTIKTGANVHPGIVEIALLQMTYGFATDSMEMELVPGIKRKRVV